MRKKGFTLIELLVVIAIIAMLLAILMPALSKVKKIAQRVVCGTNLKGLGTAQTVYAHDYNGQWTVQGGRTNPRLANATAAWQTATLPGSGWADPDMTPSVTVGASLYLLVREADVSPKSFVCPASNQKEFDGRNDHNLDLVQLWDFGHREYNTTGPENCVSYSYHMPYKGNDSTPAGNTAKKARFAADGQRSASFAVMADKSPWFDTRLNTGTPTQTSYMDVRALLPQITTADGWAAISRWDIYAGNAQPHDREGQNVLYADGHTTYETRSDVGTKNDNIYTPWAQTPPSIEWHMRRGALGSAGEDFYGRGIDDSVLVNDGRWSIN